MGFLCSSELDVSAISQTFSDFTNRNNINFGNITQFSGQSLSFKIG